MKQHVVAVVWAGMALVSGCSSSNSGNGGPPGTTGSTCGGSGECDPDRCTCTDGTTQDTSTSCIGGSCSTGGTSECTMRCSAHGGLASIAPAPNVVTSAECDAFCNKIMSLGCADTRCDRYFWCLVPRGQCEASVRADLTCQAQMEMFMCNTGGGWTGTSTCVAQASLCGGDAGSD